MAHAVTAAAHPNLALVKYWGQSDALQTLPANDSISVNLSGATTTTTVKFDMALEADRVILNGAPADAATCARVSAHLDRVRALAGLTAYADVTSSNDFPASAGVASSAAAFAALSLAATRAAGLNLDTHDLSALARRGSGSACRSIPDGFVEWVTHTENGDSYARSIAPCGHWDLRILSIIFGAQAKDISSLAGHTAAPTSPFYAARLASLPQTLADVRRALAARDLATLGMTIEREAISLHGVAMTSQPADHPWLSGIYYWQPATLAVIQAVQQWRHAGLEVYFTLDAGPSVHLLVEKQGQAAVETALHPILAQWDGEVIRSEPGRGAWLTTVDDAADDETCRL